MSRRRLALIAAMSLAVRVAYVVLFMRGYTPNSDADSYFKIGRSVSRGHGYAFTLPFAFVHATAIRPPLYPTVLAGVFRLFGAHVGVAQGVNVVAGCGAAVLGALIADRISGPRAGLCAGIVIALYPPLIANDVTVLVESIAVLLLLATVLLLLDGRTVVAGVTLGLLMLDRASAQWFVAIVAIWVVWRFGWRQAARLVVVALVVVAPWIVRNAVMVGGPVLVATNGYNLNVVYSNEAAAMPDGFVDAYFDRRFAADASASVDEVALDARLRSHALRDLRSHPTRAFHVAWVNAEHWFELRPSLNGLAERLDGRNLRVRHWTLPLFYLVTVAGLYVLWRARRAAGAQLLTLAVGYFTAVSIVSIAVPRLRSIFDACVAIVAGVALAWAIDRKTTVDDQPPKFRPLRGSRSAIALAAILIMIATAAFAWQADTHKQARKAIETAITRDAPAIDALARQYRASGSAHEPPRLIQRDLDRIDNLTTVLGDRAPEVDTNLRPRVATALRTVQVASNEAHVIALLSAAEYLDAAAKHQPPSVAPVRTRYEHVIRPDDPTLTPWNTVISGASLATARTAVDELRRLTP